MSGAAFLFFVCEAYKKLVHGFCEMSTVCTHFVLIEFIFKEKNYEALNLRHPSFVDVKAAPSIDIVLGIQDRQKIGT